MTTTETTKKRKYYKEGETVFIKSLRKTGTIKKLDITPRSEGNDGTYKATVQYGDTESVFDLWEIDKLRVTTISNAVPHDKIVFGKVRSDAKIPSKREEDGCYDLYACFDEEMMVVQSNEVRLIPTGIASAFSPKYRINCKRERGSTGKIGLMVASGQIDSGYRGEWFVALYNPTNRPIAISKNVEKTVETEDYVEYPYTKAICQFAVEIVPVVEIEELYFDQIQRIPSERGAGKIGSSGK